MAKSTEFGVQRFCVRILFYLVLIELRERERERDPKLSLDELRETSFLMVVNLILFEEMFFIIRGKHL